MLMKLTSLFLVLLLSSAGVWAQEGEVQSAQVPVSQDAVIYGEGQIDQNPRGNGRGQFLTIGNFVLSQLHRRQSDAQPDLAAAGRRLCP